MKKTCVIVYTMLVGLMLLAACKPSIKQPNTSDTPTKGVVAPLANRYITDEEFRLGDWYISMSSEQRAEVSDMMETALYRCNKFIQVNNFYDKHTDPPTAAGWKPVSRQGWVTCPLYTIFSKDEGHEVTIPGPAWTQKEDSGYTWTAAFTPETAPTPHFRVRTELLETTGTISVRPVISYFGDTDYWFDIPWAAINGQDLSNKSNTADIETVYLLCTDTVQGWWGASESKAISVINVPLNNREVLTLYITTALDACDVDAAISSHRYIYQMFNLKDEATELFSSDIDYDLED